jgi:hypothetical protein
VLENVTASWVHWRLKASNVYIDVELRAPDVLVEALGDVPALCRCTLHDPTKQVMLAAVERLETQCGE